MTEVFLKIVNMSVSAGWLVLAVLVLRLVLKKAPKWVNVLLWGLVALRLICPVSIESALSLIPSPETFPEDILSGPDFNIQSGIAPMDYQINEYLNDHYFEGVTVPTNHGANVMGVLTVIWLAGVAIMIAYTLVTYLRLRRRLSVAVILREHIYQSDAVGSPFVLGILRPRIYLPYGMEQTDIVHVIAHEEAHIRRRDHWWKPLGFALLAVYWFHPLMWVAYILLCRDIELACDEKVIAGLDSEHRADYTQALVACSVGRRAIAACPLAFGEVGVKDRVKSILNYRRPGFWVIVTALALCAVVAVCFLTDPNPSREFPMGGNNVVDLDPDAILAAILDAEDWDASNIYVNSDNFSVMVDAAFNWVDAQAVRYFFTDAENTYSAQLRLFPADGEFFLTEPTQWPEQERIFLLVYYLEALRYLPQDEIREMAPADRYEIELVDFQDAGFDDGRTITYSREGNGQSGSIDGWYIHLRVLPLHREADGQGYRGSGSEVIDLYYGDGSDAADLADFTGDLNLGLNGEIVEIDSHRKILYVKDTEESAAVFGDRCALDCGWASARYNLVYVDYGEENHVQTISFEDFRVGDAVIVSLYDNQKETAFNGTALAVQVQLATQRLDQTNEETEMQPTQTNLRGLVAEYLFVPIDGATYQYVRAEENPTGPTADELLDTFTADYQADGADWEVYSVKEHPDKSKLLLHSGAGSWWLYEYAPARQAQPGALEAARAAVDVMVEDGILTEGAEAMAEFYDKTLRGEGASIQIACSYTLDPARTDSVTYEAYRQDYPALYIHELEYDGEAFVLRTESGVRVYEYLMKFRDSGTAASHYVLTHDRSHTWEQLWKSLLSSAAGAAIDHYFICTEQQ